MPKRKCKFTDELKNKYPCFRLGRDPHEAFYYYSHFFIIVLGYCFIETNIENVCFRPVFSVRLHLRQCFFYFLC